MTEFHTTLFTALDSSDKIVIDGCEMDDTYTQITPTRRRLDLADETWITVDNQPITLVSASGELTDIHGLVHTIGFSVERQLTAADLKEPA